MAHRNQYLIASDNARPESMEFIPVKFDDLFIYAHPNLNVSTVKHGSNQIALIGYVFNPLLPDDSNEEIIGKLAEKCSTNNDFFKEIQILSGRFVILFRTETSFIVSGDACHLRQIYYRFEDEKVFLTSSLKLFLNSFNYELKISEEKNDIVNSDLFKENQSAWYGDESFDERLLKLLPNHYLDLLKKEVKRIPVFRQMFPDEDHIMEYASMVLRNTFSSLTQRYQLIQPLTAGLDSRMLLAASKEVRDKIQYYVFDPLTKNAADVWVPRLLSEKLNLDFKIIKPEELGNDFLEQYQKAQFFPRILPKTVHIQSHFDANYDAKVINVNGNCCEIARFVYGSTNKKVSFEMLLAFSRYGDKIPYFNSQLKKWYSEAVPFAEDYGISILDLFYWEQRIGNWHALWQSEQDIGVEEVSPFNNRSLINALLLVKPQKRKSPDFSFFKTLAGHLWADVLTVPINPGGNRIKKFINGNSSLKYLGLKAKKFLKKFL